MKTYAEKLRDPRWQKKRLVIMERDGFACQECGESTSPLAVHHAYYVSGRSPWMYPDWSLSTLCDACHQLRHDREKEKDQDGGQRSADEWESVIGFLGINKMSDFSDNYWDLSVVIAMKSKELKERGVAVHDWLSWAIEGLSEEESRKGTNE